MIDTLRFKNRAEETRCRICSKKVNLLSQQTLKSFTIFTRFKMELISQLKRMGLTLHEKETTLHI